MDKIEIGGKQYEVRMTWAALCAWEIATDRSIETFKGDKLFDRIIMMLCVLNGANPTQPMTYEEWQTLIDADPQIVARLAPLYVKAWEAWSSPQKKTEEAGEP